MDTALNLIAHLVAQADADDPPFPRTLVFEEGWMLRLVVQWFSQSEVTDHELSFASGARWFSEGRLASVYLPRYRGDKQ